MPLVRCVSEPVFLVSSDTKDKVFGQERQCVSELAISNSGNAGSIDNLASSQSDDLDSPLSVGDVVVDSFMRSQSAPCGGIIQGCRSFERFVTAPALPTNEDKYVSSRRNRKAVSLSSLPEYDAKYDGACSFASVPQLLNFHTSSMCELESHQFENWINVAADDAFGTWVREQQELQQSDADRAEGHGAHRFQGFRAGSDTGGSIDDLSLAQSDDCGSILSVSDLNIDSFMRSQSAPCDGIIECRHSFKRFVSAPALPPNNQNYVDSVTGSSCESSRRHRTAVSLSSLPEYGANDDGADSFDDLPIASMSANLLDEFEAWVGDAADDTFETWFQDALQQQQQLLEVEAQPIESERESVGASMFSAGSTRCGSAESMTADDGSSDGVSDRSSGMMLACDLPLVDEQNIRVCLVKTFLEWFNTAMAAISSKLGRYPWRPGMIAVGLICILSARKHRRVFVI